MFKNEIRQQAELRANEWTKNNGQRLAMQHCIARRAERYAGIV
jgi:hypothetical protein